MFKLDPSAMTVRFSNLGHFYSHVFLLLYPTVVLGLERDFALPYDQLLGLATASFVLFGAGAIPAGWLGDRWSATGMMAVFFFGVGGAAILTGLATTPWQIAGGLALIGLFGSIYHPVGLALLVQNTAKRGRTLGFNGVFGNLGTAMAALLAGALTDLIHWRAAYILPGAVAVASGVVFLVLARGGKMAERSPQAAPDAELTRAEIVRTMIVLSLTLLCAGLIYQMTAVALPKIFAVRVTDPGGGAALTAGALVTAVYLAAGFSQIVGGYLADRYPLKPVYLGAYLLQVPVLLLAANLAGLPVVFAAVVMVSLNVGASATESSLIAHYSPARWRATAFGAKFTVALGVAAVGVPLVALIFARTGGFYWLFVTMAGLAAGLVATGMFLPRQKMAVAGGPAAATATATAASGGPL